MTSVKNIKIKVIPSQIANRFIKRHHYSGKIVNNSKIHFGCFLDQFLHGVMSFGPPLDKRKVISLVEDTKWNEMLELNRLAFDNHLPRNSESRCLSIVFKLLRKNAPQIKWILSFADATQCGDGVIYRASGFQLTGIIPNENTCELPNGETMHKMTLESNPTKRRKELGGKTYYDVTGGRYDFDKYIKFVGGKKLTGYQLRYIHLIDKSCKITVPILPYSRIDEVGAGMYKGEKITVAERHASVVQ